MLIHSKPKFCCIILYRNFEGLKLHPAHCDVFYDFNKILFDYLQGPAVVVVSCVEEDQPYKTHPHNLVGKQCIKGVCRVDVSPDMTAVFPNLGIQCVRKRDSADSLAKRQEINVGPFKCGFTHTLACKDTHHLCILPYEMTIFYKGF